MPRCAAARPGPDRRPGRRGVATQFGSNRGLGGATDRRTTGPGLRQGGNQEDGRVDAAVNAAVVDGRCSGSAFGAVPGTTEYGEIERIVAAHKHA